MNKDTIVWVDGNRVGMPCKQRAVIKNADNLDAIIVKLCGTGELREIKDVDIVGVEISDTLTLYGHV